jgi:hypothetical protein
MRPHLSMQGGPVDMGKCCNTGTTKLPTLALSVHWPLCPAHRLLTPWLALQIMHVPRAYHPPAGAAFCLSCMKTNMYCCSLIGWCCGLCMHHSTCMPHDQTQHCHLPLGWCCVSSEPPQSPPLSPAASRPSQRRRGWHTPGRTQGLQHTCPQA